MQLPTPTSPHCVPFIRDDLTTRTLHFSLAEIQSRMRLQDPDALDLEYTRLMMGFLLFVPAPRRITMIGLGGGSLPKFCRRHLPRTRIDVAEINPHVIALRSTFGIPRDDGHFRVIEADGARLVAARPAHADVLLVDGYDRDGLPPALCSRTFYDDARRHLRPGGVLVANLHAGHRDHARHLERLAQAFDGAAVAVPTRDDHNVIVFAHAGSPIAALCGAARRRARARVQPAGGALRPAFEHIAAHLPVSGLLPAHPRTM